MSGDRGRLSTRVLGASMGGAALGAELGAVLGRPEGLAAAVVAGCLVVEPVG